jgi:cobalt-zinc-cadmium efflux system outer membrane protein
MKASTSAYAQIRVQTWLHRLSAFALAALILWYSSHGMSTSFAQEFQSKAPPTTEYLTLAAALKRSQQENLLLRAARFEPETARADVLTARLYPNPELTLSTIFIPSAQYIQDGASLLDEANRQDVVQIQQEILTAGKFERRIELAEQTVSVRQASYRELERTILTQTALQWLSVGLQQAALQIIRDVRATVDTLVAINRNRLKNEAITETDLRRTQIIAEQLAFQEDNTLQALRNELNVLRQLVNTPTVAGIQGADTTLQTPDVRLGTAIDSLIEQSARQRPDLQAAMLETQAAQANVRLQDANAFPNVTAGFIWNPQNIVPYIGLSVGVPLPLIDRNQGEIEKSRLQQQQATAAFEAAKLQVSVDVTIAYQTYRQQRQNLQRIERVLAFSQQVLATVRYNYLRGNTTIIDFLEAQRTFYEAQSSYNEALFTLKRSLVQLYAATGFIWDLL